MGLPAACRSRAWRAVGAGQAWTAPQVNAGWEMFLIYPVPQEIVLRILDFCRPMDFSLGTLPHCLPPPLRCTRTMLTMGIPLERVWKLGGVKRAVYRKSQAKAIVGGEGVTFQLHQTLRKTHKGIMHTVCIRISAIFSLLNTKHLLLAWTTDGFLSDQVARLKSV